ncbi:MAG: exo-alpha-sialidase [Clostridiales bacterium]|nr:exo-alpha-sialidase [Clostridiales bacterium]
MFHQESPIFRTGGRSNYRIPSMVAMKDGTILAFCNDRKDSVADSAPEMALVYARKRPGKEWEEVKTLRSMPGWCYMIGSAVYDAETDEVFCTARCSPVAKKEFGEYSDEEIRAMDALAEEKARAAGRPIGDLIYRSADGGDTWMEEVQKIEPRPFTLYSGQVLQIGGFCHGSSHGIQLRHGSHAGRLLCPSRIFTGRYSTWEEAVLCCFNNSIYSDDHGRTWHASAPVQQGTGEGTLIEDGNGMIHYNSRGMMRNQKRYLATSTDGGETYGDFRCAEFLFEEKRMGCNASFLRVEKNELAGLPEQAEDITLFANPRAETRSNMTLCYSWDCGKTWAGTKQVWVDGSAYSSLVYDAVSQHFFLLYERGPSAEQRYAYGMAVLEFDLEWLLAE